MPARTGTPTELDSARSEAAAEGLENRQPAELSASSPQRDLAALLALPRMWRNRDAKFIAGGMLDVVVSLVRSEVAYATLSCEADKEVYELARPAKNVSAAELGRLLRASLDAGAETLVNPVGTGNVRLLRVSAGLDDQQALVIVGSARADFPTHNESFLCRVAVEQAMLAVQTSRLVAGLRTANQAKSTFLATMSHELRTPLNAVVGYSELMLAGIGGPVTPQQEQYINRIEGAARHLMGLIEGILSFARLEAGKEQLTFADVDVVRLTNDVVAMIEPLATARGLVIQLTTAGILPPMQTDLAKVRQILINLLSNAVKFTNTGSVTLDVSADAEAMCWRVTDTGIGVSAGELDQIFEPFQQAAQALTGRAPGTGLGLTVSRQLARLMGGDVTATSRVGVGSTFVLRLPLSA